MDKSVFSVAYTQFLQLLRDTRRKAGLTQQQLAQLIGQSQSFVSKCERGERRIDIVELRAICQAMGLSLSTFATKLDSLVEPEAPPDADHP